MARKDIYIRFVGTGVVVALLMMYWSCAYAGQMTHSSAQNQSHQSSLLTVDQRIACERIIEKFYYARQILPEGNHLPRQPFESLVSEKALRKKVTDTIEKSDLLAQRGNKLITAEELQAEIDRMARDTHEPRILRQLWAVLGNDPYLIAECLARPIVVSRLFNEMLQSGKDVGPSKINGPEWDGIPDNVHMFSNKVGHSVPGLYHQYILPAITGMECVYDSWKATSMENVPEARHAHSVIWTGAEMIIWGGWNGSSFLRNGARYDPVLDAWKPISKLNAPSPRSSHTAVWDGYEMIVWGGNDLNTWFDDGEKYDPLNDSWAATSTINAPSPRSLHSAIWTGTEMIIWGGGQNNDCVNTGGRYDPFADIWNTMSIDNAPEGRNQHATVWTGSDMIIWGGFNGTVILGSGAKYNLFQDAWSEISSVNAPSGRYDHSFVWTGKEMIVWSGLDPFPTPTGGRYDPITDSWTPISSYKAAVPRYANSTVWTGKEMVIWGGHLDFKDRNDGSRYDPVNDSWTPLSLTDVPYPRSWHSGVWTGSEMIVWSGFFNSPGPPTGGRYCLLPFVKSASWAYAYGTVYHDAAVDIQQTNDDGYILAGNTALPPPEGNTGVVMKLDAKGHPVWQKSYIDGGNFTFNAIKQSSDNDYIVAGTAKLNGSSIYNAFVMKLDSSGNVIWQKAIGSLHDEEMQDVLQTSDGGYITAGKIILESSNADIRIIKLDPSGNVIWQTTYGGSQWDEAKAIAQSTNGNYIVIGDTASYGAGSSDIWILMLDAQGSIVWQKTYGGTSSDIGYDIQQTIDGSFVAAGSTDSFGANQNDIWILKLDENGNIVWQHTYGRPASDAAFSIQQTKDGGYIFAGESYSLMKNVTEQILVKLDASGTIEWERVLGDPVSTIQPRARQTFDEGYIFMAGTTVHGAGDEDYLILKLLFNGIMDPACFLVNTIELESADSSAMVNDSTAIPVLTSVDAEVSTVSAISFNALDMLLCGDKTCLFPTVTSNNTAEDASPCGDTGVRITWPKDPLDWGDTPFGVTKRTYSILRDGIPLVVGLGYNGTTAFTDTTGTNGIMYSYRTIYYNDCSLSGMTAGALAADTIDTIPCPAISNSLRVQKSDSVALITWELIVCSDFSSYSFYGTTSYDAPFPTAWTILDRPISPTTTDPLASSNIAYKATSIDLCQNEN